MIEQKREYLWYPTNGPNEAAIYAKAESTKLVDTVFSVVEVEGRYYVGESWTAKTWKKCICSFQNGKEI